VYSDAKSLKLYREERMLTWSEFLNVLNVSAALINLGGYLTYNWKIFTRQVTPSPGSWPIWVILAIANAATYRGFSTDLETLQSYTGAVMCAITLVYALAARAIAWPTKNDLVVLVICLLGTWVWYAYHAATWANGIICIALIISCEPTFRATRQSPEKEHELPWLLWTLGYGTRTLSVILAGGMLQWQFPTPASMMLCHGYVAWLARKQKTL